MDLNDYPSTTIGGARRLVNKTGKKVTKWELDSGNAIGARITESNDANCRIACGEYAGIVTATATFEDGTIAEGSIHFTNDKHLRPGLNLVTGTANGAHTDDFLTTYTDQPWSSPFNIGNSGALKQYNIADNPAKTETTSAKVISTTQSSERLQPNSSAWDTVDRPLSVEFDFYTCSTGFGALRAYKHASSGEQTDILFRIGAENVSAPAVGQWHHIRQKVDATGYNMVWFGLAADTVKDGAAAYFDNIAYIPLYRRHSWRIRRRDT